MKGLFSKFWMIVARKVRLVSKERIEYKSFNGVTRIVGENQVSFVASGNTDQITIEAKDYFNRFSEGKIVAVEYSKYCYTYKNTVTGEVFKEYKETGYITETERMSNYVLVCFNGGGVAIIL